VTAPETREEQGAAEETAAPGGPQTDEGEAQPEAPEVPEPAEQDSAAPGGAPDEADPTGEQGGDDAEPADPLAKAEAERDGYLELARRTQADFENYRKRAAKDMAAAGTRAKLGLLRDVLPVVDNLERALDSAQNGESGLAEGVKLVLADLQGVLAREGVDVIEPAGEPFDPTVHEALSTRPADGAEAGLVLDVVEKGYRTGETVIRPARVVVSA
jgi:molecular chaperone GrpE